MSFPTTAPAADTVKTSNGYFTSHDDDVSDENVNSFAATRTTGINNLLAAANGISNSVVLSPRVAQSQDDHSSPVALRKFLPDVSTTVVTPKSAYQQCIENYASLEVFDVQLFILVPNVPKLKFFLLEGDIYCNKKIKESGISCDKHKLTAIQMEEICK